MNVNESDFAAFTPVEKTVTINTEDGGAAALTPEMAKACAVVAEEMEAGPVWDGLSIEQQLSVGMLLAVTILLGRDVMEDIVNPIAKRRKAMEEKAAMLEHILFGKGGLN